MLILDVFDKPTRSRVMSQVRNKDTAPELRLRKALYRAGIRGYRLHCRDLPGSPDLAWIGRKVAVFVDGAFWHGHPSAYKPGQSGRFWDDKISRNLRRDREVNRKLREEGWAVIRLWDFQVDQSLDKCVQRIRKAVDFPTGPS